MSKAYVPGDDADAIIARQVAKGNFPSADAVVRAGVRLIEEYEADLVRLRKIDAADEVYQQGEYRKSSGSEAMKADILSRGRRTITPKDLIVTIRLTLISMKSSILLLPAASIPRGASCPRSSTICTA